jgi:tetratricopeptide (TPR) repeat protein
MLRLALLAVGVAFLGAAAIQADTVLVLPFFNESKTQSVDWMGESIAETIRESLASQGVLALSREDRVEGYRRLSVRPNALLTRASVLKIGEALDAGKLVYGYYNLSPASASQAAEAGRDSLRIKARIIDLKRDKQGPEFGEVGALEDLAALETHLAWQCLRFVMAGAAPSEEEFRRAHPPVRVDAMENYIRGLLASAPDQKYRLFAQAARLDSRFSPPFFQLGRISWDKKDYRVAAGWLEQVNQTDSHFLEAQFLLGLCRYYTGDFAGAKKCFQVDAAAVPLNEVFNNLAAAQSRLNEPAAADSFRKAIEGDDTDPDYHFNLGYALWKLGQFEAAAQSFRAALDRSPNDSEATSFLGRSLKREGPRSGDPKSAGRERLKQNFEETAYRQLKAELESKSKN